MENHCAQKSLAELGGTPPLLRGKKSSTLFLKASLKQFKKNCNKKKEKNKEQVGNKSKLSNKSDKVVTPLSTMRGKLKQET